MSSYRGPQDGEAGFGRASRDLARSTEKATPKSAAPDDQHDIDSWSAPEDAFCDLCGSDRHIDADASDAAGLWVCVECIETELQGACYERAHQAH